MTKGADLELKGTGEWEASEGSFWWKKRTLWDGQQHGEQLEAKMHSLKKDLYRLHYYNQPGHRSKHGARSW